jgi:hypothetical protein
VEAAASAAALVIWAEAAAVTWVEAVTEAEAADSSRT